jgi:hypothetical protein
MRTLQSDTETATNMATSADPAVALRGVAAMRRLVDELERLHVGRARAHGWTWVEIATTLGVTKQAVHAKYAQALSSPRRVRS